MNPPPVARCRELPMDHQAPTGTLAVGTTLKQSGQIAAEALSSYPLQTPMPLTRGVPPAYVSVSNKDSRCVNYNTTGVEVMVSLPCDPTAAAIEQATAWASTKVKEFLDQERSMVGGTFQGYETTGPPPPSRQAPVTLPPPRPIAPPSPAQGSILRPVV